MKRITALFLALSLLLSLIACGAKDAWQEQYDLGMRYLNDGNYQEAVIAFTAAIEIDPKRPEAYLGAAEAYIGMGDTDSARKILEKGLAATGDQKIQDKLDELVPADGNLTGQPPLTLQDMEDMGYSYGMDVYDLIASGVIADDEETRRIINWIQESSVYTGDPCFSENPHIAISQSSKMRLVAVTLFDGDTCAGPRGVRLGMTPEEVLRLFHCEDPAALEFAKTKDKALLEEGRHLWLYRNITVNDESYSDQWELGYSGDLILDEDGGLRIIYSVDDMGNGWQWILNMTVHIKDDSVYQVYMNYYYYD